jgi:hypothetical protein
MPTEPRHVTFPNYVHRFIAPNRSSRSFEFPKPWLSVHSPFDRAMVLLDAVVRILNGSMAAPAGERPFLLYVCDGRAVNLSQIRVDDREVEGVIDRSTRCEIIVWRHRRWAKMKVAFSFLVGSFIPYNIPVYPGARRQTSWDLNMPDETSGLVTGSAACPGGGPNGGAPFLGGNEQAPNNTFSASALGLTDFNNLRIIFNPSEPQNASSISLDNLALTLWNPANGFILDA